MLKTLRALGAAAALACAPIAALETPARAESPGPVCGERAAMVAALARDYGETPRVRAREARGAIVEIFVSPAGTWTLLATRPDGAISCVVGAGTDWSDKPAAAPGSTF